MMAQKQQQRGWKPLGPHQRARRFRALMTSGISLISLVFLFRAAPGFFRRAGDVVMDRVSRAFPLQEVEWQETGQSNLSAFVNQDVLWQASGLRKGAEILKVKLSEIEDRLLSIPWIESVQIQKKIPSSLLIQYTVHQARAIALSKSELWFLSHAGEIIGPASELRPEAASDLPLVVLSHGLGGEGAREIETALRWIELFERSSKSPRNPVGRLHELKFTADRFVILSELAYQSHPRKMEIWVRKDQNLVEEEAERALARLHRVAQYLIKNNILVSAIDLRPAKKIVVNVGKRP